MSADEPLIFNLAGAVLDGEALDWESLESDASDSQRALFAELQAIAAIGSLRRRRPAPLFSSPRPSHEGLTNWGQLRILESIGRGGFGSVYRAWDPQLDREVALKLLPADQDGVNALEEGRLLAKVHHPNVVTIFGADRIGNYVGLWMELVRGETLEQTLAREGPLPPARVAVLGRQLCEALGAVHRAGLVHRDVKAQNVMLEPNGRLVLMDFGAGRCVSGDRPDIAGTPLYLAPEIFVGRAASAQSDLYSAGVLLYHLLTARYPIEGRTLREVREAHRRATDRPSIRVARPDVPRRLAVAIEHALAVPPADRFQSAELMVTALAEGPVDHTRAVQGALLGLATLAVIAIVGKAAGLVPALSLPRYSPGTFSGAIPPDAPAARRLSLPTAELAGSGLSYDGRYFSFLDSNSDLSVSDLSTGHTETLVRAVGDQFAEFSIMSPDGQEVAYQWWTDRHSYEVRIVDRVTKSVRVLLRDDTLDFPMPVDWAKDGSGILLWLKNLNGVGRIVLADSGSGALQVVRQVSVGEPLGLSFSPDGRYIAYDLPISENSPSRTLHVVDRDGLNDRAIETNPDANDRYPLWTPDGRQLFFISDRSGSSEGWLIPVLDGVATAEPSLALRNLGRVSSLGLTKAGAFYYRLRAGAFEVNEITLDPITSVFLSKPRRVTTRFAASNIGPSYSRDGRQLSYVSVRDGLGGQPSRTLVIRDLATGGERELNPPNGLGNAPARWSPDGQRLLVGSRIIDIHTGRVLHEFNRHPAKDQSSYGPTRWGADGESVVYELEERGLLKHPLGGGRDEVVFAYSPESQVQRIHRFEISPDGLSLAFSAPLRDGTGTVLQVVTAGGQIELARRTYPDVLVVQAWSPDGQFVLFTTLRAGASAPHDLWRVSVWGGSPERLGSIDGATQINPMAFNPTGSALAYTTGTPLQELWVMENFLTR
jgi:Tol biopolymer transport system component/tRNA A-37 threonylcarbamoyl transferase component Bud32